MEQQVKKTWQAPTMETLDVSMTLHGANGHIWDKHGPNMKHPDDGYGPPPTDPS